MAVIITGDPLEGQQMEYFNRLNVSTPSHVSPSHVSMYRLSSSICFLLSILRLEFVGVHSLMMGSGYVSRIQVACAKGMDTRTQAPSPKAVDFDFADADTATGTRLRQVK